MPDAPKLKANEPQPFAVLKTDRQMSVVRFGPCGRILAAAGRDATIRLWDLAAAERPPNDPGETAVPTAKAGSPAKPPEPAFPEPRVLARHNGWVAGIAFHPREERLFSVDTWGQLVCWPYAEKTPLPIWIVNPAHAGWIRQVAVSPDGLVVATCGMDRRVCLWSSVDGRKLREFSGSGGREQGEDLYSLAFHPDGKSLVVGDLKGGVTHWDLATGAVVRAFDAGILYQYSYIQDVGGVRVVAFDAAGGVLACAGTQPSGGGFVQGVPTIRFFDWTSGKETHTLKMGDSADVYVHDLTFHPDGFWIGVASGQPGKGRLFFLRPGEEQPFFITTKLANCHSVAVHPHRRRLAVISNAGIHGQDKSRAREGDYPGNWSPINLWDWPQPAIAT